tara:strand:+ start:491 stop:973 length:483 start_codon:yes stop_codon:yes gene_type:complete
MKQNLIKNKLIIKLKKKDLKLCIAESVTGGKFVYEFIKKKGASSYIDYSLICYSNNSKNQLLGLEKELKKNDVISEVIAKKMAINVTKYSKNKNVIGVSCTGLASEINKNLSKMKIGTVFFAVYYKNKVKVKKKVFKNLTRSQMISETVKEMIILCYSII